VDVVDSVRDFWDADAEGYDRAPDHGAATGAERAAWSGALARLLPAGGGRVLDAGAGTGFLSVLAARLGYQVTALDLSPGMLERLRAAASREGLAIECVEGGADQPPPGPFDAVIERHLLWTLPDPGLALAAWRAVAPDGRLVLFEGMWGNADPVEAVRHRARELLRRLRGEPDHHHDHYDPAVLAQLPLSGGVTPDQLVSLVERAGWGIIRLERLRDVEWIQQLSLPLSQRLLGVTPRFVIRAGS